MHKNRQNHAGLRALAAALVATLPLPLCAAEAVLEEIVVTAQKRSESLQDVGIAVDAFRGDELRALGAKSLADVTKFSSNVQLYDEYGSGQPTWVIRGVGLQDFNPNNTPASAIYIDDVYMSSNAMGSQALFDLERIEVLKGPQGALYGRNTSGGAVRVLSKRPDSEQAGGYVSGSYGRWDEMSTEGAANVPIGDSSALRLAGRWDHSLEGWQENLVTGEEHGEQDRWALRASFLTNLGETGEALLRVHGAEDSSETVLGQTIGLYDPLTFDFCAPLLAGRLDNSSCAAYSTFFDPQFRFPDVQSDDGEETLSDPINQLDNESWGGSLELSIELGEMTLTSITGYEDFQYGLLFDYDGGYGELGHQDGRTDIETVSQELRLASAQGGRLEWLLGLEYAQDELTEDRRYMYKDDLFILTDPNVLGGEALVLGYDQETESWAAWAQVGYQLTDTLKLNAGVRYIDEEKTYENGSTDLIFDGAPTPVSAGLASDLALDIVSGKLSLDWSVADGALLYASISRGFKSGGFFGGFPSQGVANIQPYDEETNTAYEIGLKAQWLDDRLRFNAALFHYDYEDAQGYITVFDPSGLVLTRLGNVGDAEHDGVEVELLWLPAERLSLQANGAWLDAEITDSDMMVASWLGTLEPLEGRKRATAPDYSYSFIGRYTVPIGDALESTLQLDYNWRDDLGGGGLSVIETTMVELEEAYGILGARLSLAPTEGAWEVALWGHNLADEEYTTNVTTDDIASWMALPGQPLSYGVEASYSW